MTACGTHKLSNFYREAIGKKNNLCLSHIKHKLWKKLIGFYVGGIEVGDNPIVGRAEMCKKLLTLVLKRVSNNNK